MISTLNAYMEKQKITKQMTNQKNAENTKNTKKKKDTKIATSNKMKIILDN